MGLLGKIICTLHLILVLRGMRKDSSSPKDQIHFSLFMI